MLESKFQSMLKEDIESRLPECVIVKLDSGYMQGIPDLLILWRDRWAILEVKRKKPTKASDFEPNQEWYIERFNNMSFSACIYPENAEEVLDALQRSFQSRRTTRFS